MVRTKTVQMLTATDKGVMVGITLDAQQAMVKSDQVTIQLESPDEDFDLPQYAERIAHLLRTETFESEPDEEYDESFGFDVELD